MGLPMHARHRLYDLMAVLPGIIMMAICLSQALAYGADSTVLEGGTRDKGVVAQEDDAGDSQSLDHSGAPFFEGELGGISAGFHRWLGRVGTHYGDSIGAIMLAAVDDPWGDNQLLVGAVFSTLVGQYGDPESSHIFGAAWSTTEYLDSERSVMGTVALEPLGFTYSTLALRVAYRLRTDSAVSAESYLDLGYGLLGLPQDSQINGFVSVGANLVVKLFSNLHMTLGLQYRQDIGSTKDLLGFNDMSALAICNSFELVKF